MCFLPFLGVSRNSVLAPSLHDQVSSKSVRGSVRSSVPKFRGIQQSVPNSVPKYHWYSFDTFLILWFCTEVPLIFFWYSFDIFVHYDTFLILFWYFCDTLTLAPEFPDTILILCFRSCNFRILFGHSVFGCRAGWTLLWHSVRRGSFGRTLFWYSPGNTPGHSLLILLIVFLFSSLKGLPTITSVWQNVNILEIHDIGHYHDFVHHH